MDVAEECGQSEVGKFKEGSWFAGTVGEAMALVKQVRALGVISP